MEKIDVYNRQKEKIGKIVERKRGTSLNYDEYIISVTSWVVNSDGKILLTQRKFDKNHGGLWEPTTGLVISGENSLQGALRELKEEIGLNLNENQITLIKEFIEEREDINFFRDIYLVKKEIFLEQLKFADGEVINAKYVTLEQFKEMIKNKEVLNNLSYFITLYEKIFDKG